MTSGPPSDRFDLCDLEALQEKGALAFEFLRPKTGRHEIGVFWDGKDVYALENYCTHEGAMLSYGFIEPGEVICPLHSAVFDLRTGECLDKFTWDTVAYETEVRDGRVWVTAPGESRLERRKPETVT